MSPKRPVLRWHGGKWKLAAWIIANMPPHRVYTEAFGGGASVLVKKARAYAEIYNDLDGEVVNLFRCLRDQPDEMIRLLRLTPFAREEFELAYLKADTELERARRLLVRSYMGFGSDGHNAAIRTGFRANSNRSGTTPAQDWMNYPDHVPALTARLQGVIIENRPAVDVINHHDGSQTLHYVDPPYVPDTRSRKSRRGKLKYHAYTHEMTDADHRELAECLHEVKGMVLLSGYHSPLYDRLFKDWFFVERNSLADGARPRVEVLWMNPACSARAVQLTMFNQKRETDTNGVDGRTGGNLEEAPS